MRCPALPAPLGPPSPRTLPSGPSPEVLPAMGRERLRPTPMEAERPWKVGECAFGAGLPPTLFQAPPPHSQHLPLTSASAAFKEVEKALSFREDHGPAPSKTVCN
ncbi:uncharacterized protein LOC144337003 isoform X1 [Macaca mulatta]